MRYSLSLSLFISALLAGAGAQAADFSHTTISFDPANHVNLAVLDSIVANTQMTMQLSSDAYIGGNNVEGVTIAPGSFGIVAINQNTAPSANCMQAIAVNIGSITN